MSQPCATFVNAKTGKPWPTTTKGVVPQALTDRLDAIQDSIDQLADMVQAILDGDGVDTQGSIAVLKSRQKDYFDCIRSITQWAVTNYKK